VTAYKTGHALNACLVKEIVSSDAVEIVEFPIEYRLTKLTGFVYNFG